MTWMNARILLLLAASASLAGCRSTGPSGMCAGGFAFSALPAPLAAIVAATPLGGMSPPAHTVPSDHTGFYLAGTSIPLSSPGILQIKSITTTHFLSSPFRAGQSDFGVRGELCGGYELVLGHIQTLVSKLASETGGNCSTYSTADETVQQCDNNANITLAAGEAIGTVGGASAGAFDFGVYQAGHRNAFVNPSRYHSKTLTAVCPYDQFPPDLRMQIDPLIGQPGEPASGEPPRCGTMEVDVAGTAAGVWVLQSAPVNQAGDESHFASLVPFPTFPQSLQTFSLGPPALWAFPGEAGFFRYPVATSGRVNRRFRDVSADGLIYCYVDNSGLLPLSYFVSLGSGNVLTIQKVSHARGATPCTRDPSTWALDGSAVSFIR